MTVKCLTDFAKNAIAFSFVNHGTSIDELVKRWDRSRRTIMRVLEEKGVAPEVKRRNRKKKSDLVVGATAGVVQAQQLQATKIGDTSPLFSTADFDNSGTTTGRLETRPTKSSEAFFNAYGEAATSEPRLPVVIPTNTPFYRRVIDRVVELFR